MAIQCLFCGLTSPVERTDWQEIHFGVEGVEVAIVYGCPDHFTNLYDGHKRVQQFYRTYGKPKLNQGDERSAERIGRQIERIIKGTEMPPDDPLRR